MKNCSVILANLTAEDDQRFHAGRVSYSGSTGLAPRPNEPLSPYIATFLSEMPKALHAMGWKHISVKFAGEQWIVRQYQPSTSGMPHESEVKQLLQIAELCLAMATSIESKSAPSA